MRKTQPVCTLTLFHVPCMNHSRAERMPILACITEKISFASLKLMMSFVSVLRDIPAEKANHKKLLCKFKLIKIP